MHISWSFLDKRRATISAIQAYPSMDFIMKNTDAEIKNTRMKMEGVGAQNMDGLPHAHNPQTSEDRLIGCINEIDTIKERYRQAAEYMNWFIPAWNQLSEEEQYILATFYMDEEECRSGVSLIEDRFRIEKTSAYNRKNRALDHLTTLLYGKA
jgi:hypothetical protein